MITCKTPAAKRILADHLERTESPGITFTDLARAMQAATEPLHSLGYEGPHQDDLEAELNAMRDKAQAQAIKNIGENT